MCVNVTSHRSVGLQSIAKREIIAVVLEQHLNIPFCPSHKLVYVFADFVINVAKLLSLKSNFNYDNFHFFKAKFENKILSIFLQ